MKPKGIERIYKLIDSIPVTEQNKALIDEIKRDLDNESYTEALEKLESLNGRKQPKQPEKTEPEEKKTTGTKKEKKKTKPGQKEAIAKFPEPLRNPELEYTYMGILLSDPKLITKFYYVFHECYFEDDEILNSYKSVLFTEGGNFAPEIAKQDFNFSRDTEDSFRFKENLKKEVRDKKISIEKTYLELKKLFALRKAYLEEPVKEIQDDIIAIKNYKLYDQMSVEEVKDAVVQVNDTGKFKRAILNQGLSEFLKLGDNNLTNGLPLPFPILTKVFKGIRKGETMAFSMPSNSGKSRFSIDVAAHVAFVYKKKVLVISNEMSEEKMRLCLITTILNNKDIQKAHGHKIRKTEGELLEFKFRPDDKKDIELDEDGFVKKLENETQQAFADRLMGVSSEFRTVIEITNWVNQEMNNAIYFINITDHTNDELKKVIMNYYYREKIEYVFYDTLKTDTANIGIGEELKKTATILSNLAQNFGMYICSTLQLSETDTLPINLNVNDLAVSRTVKEVLDTLCLIKQINRDNLDQYEYSLNEVDTKFYDLVKHDDPDVRYYACVVDKNRAGAKPVLVFRLNLAYNVWEELGYLRLKQTN